MSVKYTTEAQLRAWAAEGKNSPDIARELGRTQQSVRACLSILGIKTRIHGHKCKADPKLVAEALRAGKSVAEIAVELCVCVGSVRTAAARAIVLKA